MLSLKLASPGQGPQAPGIVPRICSETSFSNYQIEASQLPASTFGSFDGSLYLDNCWMKSCTSGTIRAQKRCQVANLIAAPTPCMPYWSTPRVHTSKKLISLRSNVPHEHPKRSLALPKAPLVAPDGHQLSPLVWIGSPCLGSESPSFEENFCSPAGLRLALSPCHLRPLWTLGSQFNASPLAPLPGCLPVASKRRGYLYIFISQTLHVLHTLRILRLLHLYYIYCRYYRC